MQTNPLPQQMDTLPNHDSLLDKLQEFMDVYIQLMPYCTDFGGKAIHGKVYLPNFAYFLKTYDNPAYSLVIPHYQDSIDLFERDYVTRIPTAGMGSPKGIAYRHFKYWHGCKYFTGGNNKGKYTIVADYVSFRINQFYRRDKYLWFNYNTSFNIVSNKHHNSPKA